MILISKPHKAGLVSTGLDGVEDLTSGGAALLNSIDFGMHGNPDGANGSSAVTAYTDFRGGHPVGAIRMESVSGKGMIHSANKTTAPMSSPAAPASNTVRTMPHTIAK